MTSNRLMQPPRTPTTLTREGSLPLRVGYSAGAVVGGELVPADGDSLEHFAGAHADAVRILQWPDAFLANVDGWLVTLGTGSSVPTAALAELQERGLLDSRGQLTSLGENLLARLLLREGQKGDEQFHAFIQMTGLGSGSRVL